MARYRGQDGSATWATVAIPNITAWSINEAMPTVDQTVKGDNNRVYRGGIPSGTASISAFYEFVASQTTLIALISSATPTQTPAALVLTAASGKTFTTSAILTDYSVTSPEGDADCTINFSFQLSGAVAVA